MFNFSIKPKKKSKTVVSSSQNPKVLEVNLIKSEMPVDFEVGKNIGTLLFALVIAALFVAEVYLGLNWWSDYENVRMLAAETKFNQVSKEIKALKTESDQILAFKQRADLANTLLENHIYWTNFFNWLEKNTLSSVSYLGFQGDKSGVYSLDASAKTFRDISWQTRAMLESPAVISVHVNKGESERPTDSGGAEAEVENIKFNLDLVVDPNIFKNSAAN
ncbi:MAG TPA: hypothetical protein PLA05_02340 [bacterium]|nr:MAG: hypothetical protein BWX82_00721 [Parcubacteria group bacterium ADurb.Bin115]HNU81501.1 hypothetical protein [bacterium]HOD87134.1 hypothetical protein [bacterium]HPW05782.1 hypothetical protein [bacterium]HPY99500.1 hypothetical protein [bacterium]